MMGTWRRICDDRQEDIRRIETAIRKSLNKTGQAVRLIISSFLNGGQLYDAACRENFDLLFLDIEMKPDGMNGVELASKLRKNDHAIQIVFVTGYMEYIADGYDVEALHYLLKPVTEAKWRVCLSAPCSG